MQVNIISLLITVGMDKGERERVTAFNITNYAIISAIRNVQRINNEN